MQITEQTPWRMPIDVTYDEWHDTITSARNPNGTGERADPELASEAAYNAARPHSALALAQLKAESSYGTDFDDNPRSNKCPFNLKSPSYDGTYVKFDTWVAGVKGWHDRITSPTYKNGAYAKTESIHDLIFTFAPESENRTQDYIDGVVERMNEYEKAVPVNPKPTPIPAPIPAPMTWRQYFDLMFGTKWAISQEFGVRGQTSIPGDVPYEYGIGHGLDGVQHPGTDIGIPYGTKLYAPAAATVVCGGTDIGGGAHGQGCSAFNDWGDAADTIQGIGRIELQFANGNSLIYGHARTCFVKPGDRVTAGQLLGTSGGMYGPHCHLEARDYKTGDYMLVNPKGFLEGLSNTGGGSIVPVSLDYSGLSFPVEVRIIPASHTHQRTGLPLKPTSTTWHDTDNRDAGADTETHADWQFAGCPDENGNPTDTSWHFTVDDHKAIQHIPLNEVAWHAGDGRNGPGNQTSIAIEECVNADRNAAKTRSNTAELHGFLRARLGINETVQHNRWSQKDCPKLIRSQGLWPQMTDLIAGFITKYQGTTPGPVPGPTPTPSPAELVPGIDIDIAMWLWGEKVPGYKLARDGGILSAIYKARCIAEGVWPQLVARKTWDVRVYYQFSNGWVALFNDKTEAIQWIGSK